MLVAKEDGDTSRLVVVRAWGYLEDFLHNLDDTIIRDGEVLVAEWVDGAAVADCLDELSRGDLAGAWSLS